MKPVKHTGLLTNFLIVFIIAASLFLPENLFSQIPEESAGKDIVLPGAAGEFPVDMNENKSPLFEERFVHVTKDSIGFDEKLFNIGFVYAMQWIYYGTVQGENIKENGSFKNWHSNMYKIQMDKDSYDYNLVLHTLTGNGYYLFFRSRGYSKHESMAWSFVSQFLFEFTVETITEPPSIQDLYQTPVLGTLAGITSEYLSLMLLNSKYSAVRFWGYVLNPFTLLDISSYEVRSVPVITSNGVSIKFEAKF